MAAPDGLLSVPPGGGHLRCREAARRRDRVRPVRPAGPLGHPGRRGAQRRPVECPAAAGRRVRPRVGYHNHDHEFTSQIDGRSALEVFADLLDPSVQLEVDLYWATAGGADPVELAPSPRRPGLGRSREGRPDPPRHQRPRTADRPEPAGQVDVPLAAVLSAETSRSLRRPRVRPLRGRRLRRPHRELPLPEDRPCRKSAVELRGRGLGFRHGVCGRTSRSGGPGLRSPASPAAAARGARSSSR